MLYRWLDYSPYGHPVEGTLLLPIKLPIPNEKSYNISPNMRFTLDNLIEGIHSHGSHLACVIDLTYTRYYDPKLVTSRGIQYHKIFVEGHEVPHIKHVRNFAEVVNAVRARDPGGMLAPQDKSPTYIIEELGRSPEKVIFDFALARGYPIERDNYIDALMKLSKSRS
ncbi:unnamed protein product [Echinostoma caproni]|uniref:DUF362 domain-containing protein n=1 Tax=Echinostoma caproni TaxID=27848 RepID=A0A183AIE6_9TREM|nr:unnamed protein product [Echinostoma caproni]